MSIIETHCHLDYLKEFPLAEILNKARLAGVSKIITIAVEPDNLDEVIKISSENDMVYCTQGVHPHDSIKMNDETLKRIRENAKLKKVVAIGEIGLDYHYNNSPQDIQRKRFEEQLSLATELKMPVVIHTRDADEDTKAILKNFSGKLTGVIHSFTSSLELAKFCLSEGFHLGFNGIITFPKAQNVRDVLAMAPIDRILIETDSPFLTPVPFRGKENNPSYLPFVMKKVAEVKNQDEAILMDQIMKNSLKLFWEL